MIATVHCDSATRAVLEINGWAAQLAYLLVVLCDPQSYRLQLCYRLRTFPEFPGRSAVFLSSDRSPAAHRAGSRAAWARPARRVRRRRHCVFCSLRCLLHRGVVHSASFRMILRSRKYVVTFNISRD